MKMIFFFYKINYNKGIGGLL
jgi:hypothetical protein